MPSEWRQELTVKIVDVVEGVSYTKQNKAGKRTKKLDYNGKTRAQNTTEPAKGSISANVTTGEYPARTVTATTYTDPLHTSKARSQSSVDSSGVSKDN
jgi:hypothetical protein